MTVLQTGRIVAAQVTGLTKVYGRGDTAVHALAGVSLSVEHGRFTAIMGRSGSGKSTLMHCLAGLDSVTGGTVEVGGVELSGLSDRQLTQFRREHVGFVFQSYNLLPMLTAKQNILLPLDLAGREPDWPWFDRLVGVLEAEGVLAGDVVGGEDGADPGHGERLGDVDPPDAGVRVRAAQRHSPHHVVVPQVAGVGELAGDLERAVGALRVLPDPPGRPGPGLGGGHRVACRRAASRTASRIFS